MDKLAIQFARLNGAQIYTFGEAKVNNEKLNQSKLKFESKIKRLEDNLKKTKEEKEKNAVRLEIIKSEQYIDNIVKLLSRFDEEFKDFIEVEKELISNIKEVEIKVSSLQTKKKSDSETLDKIYISLADENNKDEDKKRKYKKK